MLIWPLLPNSNAPSLPVEAVAVGQLQGAPDVDEAAIAKDDAEGVRTRTHCFEHDVGILDPGDGAQARYVNTAHGRALMSCCRRCERLLRQSADELLQAFGAVLEVIQGLQITPGACLVQRPLTIAILEVLN